MIRVRKLQFMDKRLFNIVGTLFILAVTLIGVNAFVSGNTQKPALSAAAPHIPNVKVFTPQISPSPKPSVPQIKTVSSPDGNVEAKLTQLQGNPKNTWTFNVGDKKIFESESPISTIFTVPDNTFSPDNKYVFLIENAGGIKSYIVFKANGEAFSDTQSSVEIASLFEQKVPGFKITDVTGWAAPNLLIVNTDKAEGGEGPSFWFSVNSENFTKLSNRFN